jgi:predicted small secreted protein
MNVKNRLILFLMAVLPIVIAACGNGGGGNGGY